MTYLRHNDRRTLVRQTWDEWPLDRFSPMLYHTSTWKTFPGSATVCAEGVAALAVSAISFWEIDMLHRKGRIRLLQDVAAWRTQLLDDGAIAIRVNRLLDFHPDPVDRFIVATALGGHSLLTAGRHILYWDGDLKRLDAR